MFNTLAPPLVRATVLAALTIGMTVGCSSSLDELETSEEASALTSSETVTAGTKLRVTASRLNVRDEPSTSGDVIETLNRDAIVTVATTSNGSAWIDVKTPSGERGYVSAQYVARVAGTTPTPTPGTGSTCSPSRAAGAVDRYQKALHDSIAFAEGTRGYSKDGYDVMFSHKIFTSCASHPDRCWAFGNTCSTAAGRYQFLTTTWNTTRRALGLSSFEPENQERGAQYLVKTVRKVTMPSGRPLTATEFSNAMSKLSYEWASLPPGRYGQPNKSMSQMRSTYCSLAGC